MRATLCPECKYTNGGIFTVCPVCKTEQPGYVKARERSRRHGPRNRHPAFRSGARKPEESKS